MSSIIDIMQARIGIGLTLLCAMSQIACEGDLELLVDLKTDYAPGVDFTTVQTEVLFAGGGVRADATAETGQSFILGQRVAELTGVKASAVTVRVRLLDEAGELVAERPTIVDMRDDFGLTVLVSRRCEDVTCPGSGDPGDARACLAGQCVDERCSPEAAGFCGPPMCAIDAECPTSVACATGRCIDGACLFEGNDAACAAGQYCNSGIGCRAISGTSPRARAYVLDADPAGNPSVIWAYDVGPDGDFTPAPSPSFDVGMPTQYIVAGPRGDRLYVTTRGGTVHTLAIDPRDGGLSQIDVDPTSPQPWMATVHPSGNWLYISDWSTSSELHGFAIADDGTLNPIAGSPWTHPGGGVIWIEPHPTRNWLYASGDDEIIYGYDVSATGELTPNPAVTWTPVPPTRGTMVVLVSGGGTYGFIGQDTSGAVPGITVDLSTGALSTTPGSPFGSNANTTWHGVMDATRRRLFMANQGDGTFNLTAYLVDEASGGLAHLGGSPVNLPEGALSVAASRITDDIYAISGSAPSIVQFRATDTAITRIRDIDLPSVSGAQYLVLVEP